MAEKQFDDKLAERSVKIQPEIKEDNFNTLTLFFSQANTLIQQYGTNTLLRDSQLRDFILQEPYLLSAVYSIVASRSALSWELTGPPKSVKIAQNILLNSDYGNGWNSLIGKVTFDLAVCDNGAFIEIVRDKPRPGRNPWTAPVIGINHLDSNKCIRTGNYKTPILYLDDDGQYHKLNWWDVITLEEFPNPDDDLKGIQISFVSRVLKAAEIMRSIMIYREEKVSGRFTKGIHLVSGVAQHELEAIQATGQLKADDAGYTRYAQALILASLDPNAKVAHEYIEMATLPDGYDEDTTMKYYIALLATAGGMDFMDLAPLPSQGLGSSEQSNVLANKSRLKGLQLFIKLVEHKLTLHKVLPPNVEITFGQKDPSFEEEFAKTRKLRADERAVRITSGEINVEVARQIAVDEGDLKQEYLILLGDTDITPSITVEDDDNVNMDVINEDIQQTIETTPVEERAKVHISLAEAAAQWVRKLIDEHPIQNVAPISNAKLNVFTTALRNMIQREMTIKTTLGWHDYILTLAAREGGIEPHALRLRLPDEYKLYVTKEKVFDNEKRIIKELVEKDTVTITKSIQVTNKEICDYCTKNYTHRTFIPTKGWINSCSEHYLNLGGFVGRNSDVQYNFKETLNAFEEQYVAIGEKFGYNSHQMLGLVTSVLGYVLLLKSGKNDLSENEKMLIRNEIGNIRLLVKTIDIPTPFVSKFNKIYLN